MSIFPEWAKSKEAVTPAKAGVQSNEAESNGLDSSVRWNDKGEASSKAHKPKPHRFDKFALKLAANMITAIRTTLGVFTSPDKDRWPAEKLLDYLNSAEEMARGMLREIAAKITILPGKARERAGPLPMPPQPSPERAPYFRLGVGREDGSPGDEAEKVEMCASPSRLREGDRGGGHPNAVTAPSPLTPLPSDGRGGCEPDNDSLFQSRLAALQDVLAHPGKHAARMARALYRAAHEAGGRLTAKSPDDLLLDRVNRALGAHLRGDAKEAARLHKLVLDPG